MVGLLLASDRVKRREEEPCERVEDCSVAREGRVEVAESP